MAELTLLREANPLADPAEQMRVLRGRGQAPAFEQVLRERSGLPLQAKGIEILQVNVGKVCNQTCRHCHVDAGPDRREAMSREVAEACIRVLDRGGIPTLDITGGAPEMNPHFRWLVSESARLKRRVIDRCNLTILVAPGYEDLPEFLAEHAVEVVASLPCYLEQNVDRQRGNLVFQRSIQAIRRLNELGYGVPGSSLTLTLVFNPTGASLPPPQLKLEDDYRRELRARYGLEFNHLFTITNMPISRFLDDLIRQDKLEQYMRLLVDAFNPGTIDGLMCRSTLSVDWRGNLFDCDFNQMLEIPVVAEVRKNIVDIAASPDLDLGPMSLRAIVTGQHCFGCTAGAGSSCQGSLAR